MTAVVKARSLTKRFAEVPAVTDLSFALKAGTITGLLGPSGHPQPLRRGHSQWGGPLEIAGLLSPLSRGFLSPFIHSMSACQLGISSQHRLSVIGRHSPEALSWPSRLERRILSEQTGEFFGSGALHNERSYYGPKPYNLCWSPNSALLGHGCRDRPNRWDLVGMSTGPSHRSVGPSPPWRWPRC